MVKEKVSPLVDFQAIILILQEIEDRFKLQNTQINILRNPATVRTGRIFSIFITA